MAPQLFALVCCSDTLGVSHTGVCARECVCDHAVDSPAQALLVRWVDSLQFEHGLNEQCHALWLILMQAPLSLWRETESQFRAEVLKERIQLTRVQHRELCSTPNAN